MYDTLVIWACWATVIPTAPQQTTPRIQFTVKEEKDDKLSFFDVLVTKEEGRLLTSVYWKPTHTERYIPYHTHYHLRTAMSSHMWDRTCNICHPIRMQQKMDHQNQVFQANGFQKPLQEGPSSPSFTYPWTLRTTTTRRCSQELVQPLHQGGLSEKIAKVCALLAVKPVFRPMRTLKKEVMQVQTRTPEQKQTGVAYEIPCKDCSEVYVWETN